jgi:hypothetical protein
MAGWVDICRYTPTLGGTTDWTFSAAVTGYQSPTAAGIQNSRVYKYRAENTSLSEWEIGEGAYNTGTGVLARTTVLFNSLGSTSKINFSAAPQVAIVALKEDLIAGDESGLAFGMTNGQLVASAAAGALTVALKTTAGNDPSVLDPVYFYFRDNTLTLGDIARVAAVAATSVVLGSTKTLGATSAQGLRVWIGAFNNAGTVQLGAMNCSDSSGIFCPQQNIKYTTAVPASASKTWYSTSAIGTAAPWRFIGFCEWTSLTTAGTWVAPDIVQLYGPGLKKPGDLVQYALSQTGTLATGSTTIPNDNTIPQSTEGDQYMSQAITPSAAANRLRVTAHGIYSNSAANEWLQQALFQDATANALATTVEFQATATAAMTVPICFELIANTTSSTTFKIRAGGNSAGTTSFNGAGGVQLYGGVADSFLRIEELMA